jgi:hypothetical protein
MSDNPIKSTRPVSSREAREYPDPTPQMLANDPLFDAIWDVIKGWDISRYRNGLYSGATGNDVRHIYDAVMAVGKRLSAAHTITQSNT